MDFTTIRNRFTSWKVESRKCLENGAVDASPFTGTLLCCLALGVVGAIWMLWRCNYGYDFTDESFYLIKIAAPWREQNDIALFGYVYHPLFRLLGGDVVLFRQIGMLFHLLLAWGVCWEFLGIFVAGEKRGIPYLNNPLTRGMLAFAFAAGGLFAASSILTPGYNELNKTAFLLACIGILRAGKQYTFRSVSGWIIIGVAGYISFLAKPPSAAFMGVTILAYLLVARKFRITLQLLSLIVFFTLLLVTEIAIHGSISKAFESYTLGFAATQNLGSRHSISGLFRFNSPARLFRPKMHGIASNLFFFLILGCVLWSLRESFRKRRPLALILLAGSALVILDNIYLGVLARSIKWLWNTEDALSVSVWQLGILGCLGVVLIHGWEGFKKMPAAHLALFGCLVIFPYAFGFGSEVNYLFLSGFLTLFIMLALLLLLFYNMSATAFWRTAITLAALTQLIAFTGASIAMEHPFRQATPYREATNILELPNSPSSIKIGDDVFQYTAAVRDTARRHGFTPGTPIINTTLYGIGLVYLLEGYPSGSSWMISPAGNSYFTSRLGRETPETLARSWILLDSTKISEDSRSMLNVLLPGWEKKYTLVGSFTPPQWPYGPDKVYLYKPPAH